MRGVLVFISQMLGAICSAAVVSALFPGSLAVRTSLGGGTSITQGLFIEMFLTAQLVFTIIMLAAEKHKGTFLAPVGIGLSLFIAELSGEPVHSPHPPTQANTGRCLLYWWLAKSCSILRSRSRFSLLLRLSLDILGRPRSRCPACLRILLVCQDSRIPDCKPWTGLRRSRSRSVQP